MKITKIKKCDVRRELIKGYLQLLTQAAEKVDGYLFDDSEESDEVRSCFYGSLAFGITVCLFLFIKRSV
ncbi:hypothetical protein [Lysinibacillus telephonicus]|uniref:hypothetical protein n=1 Tax=Lysinibacillus telephonicus TaxID=1714840 RepID=UPI0037CE0D45